MLLSILICTVPERSEMFNELVSFLNERIVSGVEIISDNSSLCIGAKRNSLLSKAVGTHIVFIDDDDAVSSDYIDLIVNSIKASPGIDCIGINGMMTTNGLKEKVWFISKDNGTWYEKDDVFYRTPNHISPVRRELALLAGFPEIMFGEDYEYSMRLLPLLKSEVIISQPLYHYKYTPKQQPQTRKESYLQRKAHRK